MSVIMGGLIDTASINDYTETSDGYGGLINTLVAVVSSWKCRRTVPKDVDAELLALTNAGYTKQKIWKFSGEFNSSIVDGLFLTLNSIEYKILKVVPKRDALGTNHHLHLYAEKRDED